MFQYDNQRFKAATVETANPQYAKLLEKLLSGEQEAALRFISQGVYRYSPEITNLFFQIATEKLNHSELLSHLIQLLYESPPHPSAPYPPSGFSSSVILPATGDLQADLLLDIANQQLIKSSYQSALRQIHDKRIQESLCFLIERTELQSAILRKAFNRIQRQDGCHRFEMSENPVFHFTIPTSHDEFTVISPRKPKKIFSVHLKRRNTDDQSK